MQGGGGGVAKIKINKKKQRDYHFREADRIKGELDGLSSRFAENGIVKTVLRARIEQEKQKVFQIENGLDGDTPIPLDDKAIERLTS